MFTRAEVYAVFGATTGLLIGIGWLTTLLGNVYLFEIRIQRSHLIHAGYYVGTHIVMGLNPVTW